MISIRTIIVTLVRCIVTVDAELSLQTERCPYPLSFSYPAELQAANM